MSAVLREGVSEAFVVLAELCVAVAGEGIARRPGIFEYQIDADWSLAFNGSTHEARTLRDIEIPPLHFYLECRGWPAGYVGMDGGMLLAGGEADLIDKAQAAIARQKAGTS